ncbi:MAG: endonuclease MutS2, partial [Chloroflexota bacterium]|jgi:DNA mismatch repair protein MutS2
LAKAKLAEAMRATTPLLVDLSPRSRRGDAETRRQGDTNREGLDSQHSELRTQNRTQDAGLRTQDSLPPCVRLVKARHPLLTGNVVPITVELGADFDILVITGPNTGGKTVALKTVGLLCLMAQCGLQIPAEEGSSVGVFRSVYADIGDEQSIEQSLSTFSSHVTHIVDILDKADETSLVLLDELGAGTDPQEGSALARAILSHLLDRKVPTIATTHYSELKSFAHTTPRVENASVEFDLETLSPTYRLSIGLPGRSNALAIATRLGMRQEIIEEAKQMLQPTDLEIEGLLAQLQADREQARSARAEAERLREQLRSQRARLNAELADIEERRYSLLEKAREQSEHELAALRQKVQQVMRELEQSRLQANAQQLAAAVAQQAEKIQPLRAPKKRRQQRREPVAAQHLKVGQAVYLPSLQRVGTITSLLDEKGEVEVQLGSIRTRVKAGELSRTDQRDQSLSREPEITYRVDMDRAPAVSLQLDLRGRRVEEAQEELDQYLHDAYMAGLKVVRIIHGKGTGAVRQAVRMQLDGSPLVRHYEPAEAREGGDGATVVSLAN